MKKSESIVVSFILLVLMASLYRILPERPLGFAPQIAMALFAGSVVKDKKYAFLLPLFSMLVSDILYEVLFQFKISAVPGFYGGQLINYVLFVGLTVVGFAIKKTNPVQIFAGSIGGATIYYLLSNFTVWIGGGLDITNQPYQKQWLDCCIVMQKQFLFTVAAFTLHLFLVLFCLVVITSLTGILIRSQL